MLPSSDPSSFVQCRLCSFVSDAVHLSVTGSVVNVLLDPDLNFAQKIIYN